MKIFVDNEQVSAPRGWQRIDDFDEVIRLLKTRRVTDISLTHAFNETSETTGYDILKWIRDAVAKRDFVSPTIHIHGGSKLERRQLLMLAADIKRMQP